LVHLKKATNISSGSSTSTIFAGDQPDRCFDAWL